MGATLPLMDHAWGIVAVDPTTGRALTLDYADDLEAAAGEDGRITAVSLFFDAGSVTLPVRVWLLVDGYPVAGKGLGAGRFTVEREETAVAGPGESLPRNPSPSLP